MANMFADRAKIYVRSGKGGDGHVSFRRELYVPNGGPDGGDGGKGGDVIFVIDKGLNTLTDFKNIRKYKAGDGEEGGKKRCHGKNGNDVVIKVPPGTVIKDFETGKIIVDMADREEPFTLLTGGRGGKGNMHYATSTMQAPRYAQPGEPAIEKTLTLELKMIADVGLVGFPSVGKSTILSKVSNAKPKIADYHFTTLVPNLGVVGLGEGRGFVMADIPGIIEGASEGKGLGLRFLRHIERNSLLLFMVPGDTDDIKREYEILLNELAQFNPELLDKHRVLAVTKCDLLDDELMEMLKETLPNDLPVVFISAVSGFGLEELKDVLWRELNAESNKLAVLTSEDSLVHRDKDMSRFAQELADEGEDEDIEYIDEDEIEDIEDFEYEEDFEAED